MIGGEKGLKELSWLVLVALILSNQYRILYLLTRNKVDGFAMVLFTLLAGAMLIAQLISFVK